MHQLSVQKYEAVQTPCVTDEIRALMKTRDIYPYPKCTQKLARKTNDPLAWSGYKNFKRDVRAVFHFNRIVAKRSVFYCVHITSSA